MYNSSLGHYLGIMASLWENVVVPPLVEITRAPRKTGAPQATSYTEDFDYYKQTVLGYLFSLSFVRLKWKSH